MPSDKYFGKNKEDLVLIATLGLVLTREQAEEMSREELAAYLFRKEQELAAEIKYNENIKNKEKKSLVKKRIGASESAAQDEEQPGAPKAAARRPGRPPKSKNGAKPESKLSKKELNKLLFLQEIAKKDKNDTIITDIPQDESDRITEVKPRKKRTSSSEPSAYVEAAPAIATAQAEEAIPEMNPEEPLAETTVIKKKRGRKPKSAAVEDISAGTRGTAIAEETAIPEEAAIPAAAAVTGEETGPDLIRKTRKRKTASTENETNIVVEIPASAQTREKAQEQAQVPVQEQEQERPDAGKADEQESEKKQETEPEVEVVLETVEGALEIMPDGYGFLRKENYLQSPKDIYIPPQYIRRFNLRVGDWISGPGKVQRETDRYQGILYVKEVNGLPPEQMLKRPQFDKLTPIYPDEKFILETGRNELSTRIIDLIAPIGKGQRGMIVSPPKAGKTILLQKIANAIATNNPGTKLIVLLIDERPEEVTDMQRSINGEVVYSTFDKTPENHVKVVELVLERAMRLVELGQDVVILLDSITRLSRAYNLTINPTGRTLSGGLDPGALYGPKRFFGAARNIENGGSLTIIATSLIETGSRMDEVIFEEFKGTGNMEVYLDRKLSEKRIFPAIDINRSGTRREELLLTKRELDAVWTIRKAFSQLDTAAVTEMIINLLLKTNNNSHFVSSVNVSLNDKAVYEAMRGNKPGGAGNASASQNQPGNSGNGNMNGNSGNYSG
ncbi:MAG: transcription termination factor Rho [Saccharofermentanales bacterium]